MPRSVAHNSESTQTNLFVSLTVILHIILVEHGLFITHCITFWSSYENFTINYDGYMMGDTHVLKYIQYTWYLGTFLKVNLQRNIIMQADRDLAEVVSDSVHTIHAVSLGTASIVYEKVDIRQS